MLKYSYVFLALVALTQATHIDNLDNELTNFKFDSVIFRLQKDCSLDRIPDVRMSKALTVL